MQIGKLECDEKGGATPSAIPHHLQGWVDEVDVSLLVGTTDLYPYV
jgi:hypothetical protein